MKIKSLKVKNFGNIKEFTTNLGSGVNYITASNGKGKSTVGVTSILALMKGIGERGDVLKGIRVMWIGGAGDKAEIEAIIYDEHDEYTVSREIKEDNCPLTITSKLGKKLDQKWLDSIFSGMMLSPVAFSRLTAKEQAECMGIDTSEFDEKILGYKLEAQGIRAIIKDFGEIEMPERVEAVDIAELSKEKDRIVKFNQEQSDIRRQFNEMGAKKAGIETEIARLNAELERKMSELKDITDKMYAHPILESPLFTDEIDQKISAASETNAKAIAYQQAINRAEQKQIKEALLADNIAKQNGQIANKVDYMQGLDLPFSNLTIDEKGGLMMDGRPIKEPEFSTAECIKICTLLLASRNPEWKYVFLPGFDLLDDVKSKEVLDFMLEGDFQVLAEKVVSNQSEVLILQDV